MLYRAGKYSKGGSVGAGAGFGRQRAAAIMVNLAVQNWSETSFRE